MGKDLAVPARAQLEAVYLAVTENKPLPQAADPEQMSRLILERIMAAETFEEAFVPQKIDAWRDKYLEVPVKVLGVHFNRSTIEGGLSSVYAVVDLVDTNTGETATVTCGGRNVLVQLLKMLEKGEEWMDREVRLTQRQTSEGYKVLWLEAA